MLLSRLFRVTAPHGVFPMILISLILTCGLGRDVVNGLLDGLDLVSIVVGDLEAKFLG